MPGGRPSKYKSELLEQAEELYSIGATDQEVADLFEVTTTTIDNWKKTKPEFLAALKRGKAWADGLVEKSLYEQAISGNTTAQIFWLKNRRPKVWRDKRDYNIEGNMNVSPWEKFQEAQSGRDEAGEDNATE